MPISTYLDQCVYSKLLESRDGWQEHPLGQELLGDGESTEVWITPYNVLELSLYENDERRCDLARLMLELAGARRLDLGWEVEVIKSLGRYLEECIPGAYREAPYLDHYLPLAASLWLGHVGLFASGQTLEPNPVLRGMQRAKALTELQLANILEDPDAAVAQFIKCARGERYTAIESEHGVGEAPVEELRRRAAESLAKRRRASRKTLRALQANRELVARYYGALDLAAAIRSYFLFPASLPMTFDAQLIVAQWSALGDGVGCAPLPERLRVAVEGGGWADPNIVHSLLLECLDVAAKQGLVHAATGRDLVLRELESAMRRENSPTPKASIMFDTHHAHAALQYDLFVTHDETLAKSIKIFRKRAGITGKWVATKPKDIRKAKRECRG